MPKKYQNQFKAGQLPYHQRQKNNGVYEIRCQIDGVAISASSKSLAVAKRKFIARLRELDSGTKQKKDMLVYDFVVWHIENVKAVSIVDRSVYNKLNVAKNHIAEPFRGITVKAATASHCQSVLNQLLQEGKERTAEDVKTILNDAFFFAVGEKMRSDNPMDFVKIPKHIRKNGTCIDLQLVLNFLAQNLAPSKYIDAIKIMLFTGVRSYELRSLELDGNFLTVINAKQPKGAKKNTETNSRSLRNSWNR